MTIPVALLLLGVPTEHVGFIAAGHTPLTITSDSTPDVNTGDTAVVTVTTSGSFGDIDFAIVGGADAGLFTINDETGALSFRATSVDGTYEVIVRAFSDWGSATQTITATVATQSYTGPLDLVAGAVVAYSLRAMTAGSTANAITVRRDSDDASQTFALTDNAVDVAAVTAFLGGANGFVTTWNDQSGNSLDVSQASAAIQPGWTASAQNSKPGLVYIGQNAAVPAKPLLATAGTPSLVGAAYTTFAVFKKGAPDLGQVNFIYCWGDTNNGPYAELSVTTNGDASADTYTQDRADADFAAECGQFSSDQVPTTNCVVYDCASQFGNTTQSVNGVALTGDSSDFVGAVSTFSGTLFVGAPSANPFLTWTTGNLLELLIYPSLLSDADRLLVRQNMADYYGITLS